MKTNTIKYLVCLLCVLCLALTGRALAADITLPPISFHWEQDSIADISLPPISFQWQEDSIADITLPKIAFHWEQDSISDITLPPIKYHWSGVQLIEKPVINIQKNKNAIGLKTGTGKSSATQLKNNNSQKPLVVKPSTIRPPVKKSSELTA